MVGFASCKRADALVLFLICRRAVRLTCTEVDECAVVVDHEVDAGTRAERGALRLYVGHLHQPVLPTAVLHTDTRVRRRRRKLLLHPSSAVTRDPRSD